MMEPRLMVSRVLVVDDAPPCEMVVTHILSQDGAKVTAVGSAGEALAAWQGSARTSS
jgi:CheY-like chemotaxis protein